MTEGRTMIPLTRRQSLARLAAAPYGRVIFTQRAMPAVRHVNHLLRDGLIIIRSQHDAAITARASAGSGAVVLFQADDIDPAARTGWTVTVTGLALPVTDPDQAAAYRERLRPWIAGSRSDIISITADIVIGFELAPVTGREGYRLPAARRGEP